MFEIGGNAVLFMTQQVYNTETLMRIIIDGQTGSLISENIALRSKSFGNTTRVHVLKRKEEDGYVFVCYNYKKGIDSLRLLTQFYNNQHTVIRESYFAYAANALDYIVFLGTGLDNDGSVLSAIKTIKVIEQSKSNESKMILVYTPPQWSSVYVKSIGLPEQDNVSGVRFKKNAFANNINLLVNSTEDVVVHIGINNARGVIFQTSMLIMPEDLSAIKERVLEHKMAITFIKKEIGDSGIVTLNNPILDAFDVNKLGVTTTIYKEAKVNREIRQYPIMHAGRYLVTKYSDDGEEIWAVVLPSSRYEVGKELPNKVFRNKYSIAS